MKYLVVIAALICSIPSLALAQVQAYGVRGGAGWMSNGEGVHGIVNIFYDVPMGDILFSPELVLITSHSPEPAYGLNVKFRRQLGALYSFEEQRQRFALVADLGAQFIVWDTITTAGGPPKRANFGFPLGISAEVPTGGPLQFEVTLSYTPMFFLGNDPYIRSLFSVLGAIRILVP